MVPISFGSPYVLLAFAFIVTVNAFKSQDSSPFLPRTFIVKLDPKKSRSLQVFQEHLNVLGIRHRVIFDLTEYDPSLFYGASLEVSKDEDVKYLQESAHVQKISQVRAVSPANTFNHKIIHEPVNATHGFPPHIQTRVSELHRMGIYGQGVRVAFIDSGIDCKHPAFGQRFGPGFKIGFGRSFIPDHGDHNHKQNYLWLRSNGPSRKYKPKKPKSPCSPCGTHGTHVAGIVAAADVGFGFTGVAPNVTIGMYRVFDCEGGVEASDDMVLAAALQAHKDGADIISASLGESGGWGQGSDIADVLNKLVQYHGVIVTVAAGNDGSEGAFFADSPASSKNVISVGSVDSDANSAVSFKTSTGKELELYRTLSFNLSGEYPIYLTASSTNDAHDACDKLPNSTPNLAKYVVLIKRGTCPFSEKAEHAAAHGAKYILFYMNSTNIMTLSNELANASVGSISFEDGKYLFDQSKKNPKGFKVSFPPSSHFYVKNPGGGFMSTFSEYGPSFDFESPQPAVSAVGGNVVSTYPVRNGSYASLSGTSMAAPQLAGIAALILSARGKKKYDGLTIRARLATTAKLLKTPTKSGIESVVHQGGGLIDAFCAVWTNTSISTPTIALKDSDSFQRRNNFTVVNHGTDTIDYFLTHLAAQTILTLSSKSKYNRPDVDLTYSNDTAAVKITPQKFSLRPHSSQVIEVDFTRPSHSDRRFLPIYSGYVVMSTSAECESHNVPYYGVLGSLKNRPIIDRGTNENKTINFPYLSFPSNSSRNATRPGKKRPLKMSFVWDLRQHNRSYLNYRTLLGSPLVRADVIAGDAVIPNKTTNCNLKNHFRGTPLIGMMPDSEDKQVSRSGSSEVSTIKWNGTIVAPGKKRTSILPNGHYKVLLRALHIGGNKQNTCEYDYWISPKFFFKNLKR